MVNDINQCTTLRREFTDSFGGNMEIIMSTFSSCLDDITRQYKHIQSKFEGMESRILFEKEDLINKQYQWLQEKEAIRKVNQLRDDFVNINAGGVIVTTTIDTLTGVDNSRLQKMFLGEITEIM